MYTLAENHEENEVSEYLFMENLWNFDAVFLCVTVLGVITSANITVAGLMETQRDFSLRKKVVELNCPPARVRTLIEKTGAQKKTASSPYYVLSDPRGTARLRQLGNKNRVRIVVEASDMEAAKELSGEISAKLSRANIDKKIK